MQPLPLVLAALIAAAAVLAVAMPFVRRPRRSSERGPDAQPPQLELLERRDRALAALAELEFDHRTGKIADADYHRLLGPLRGEAAEALRLVRGTARRAVEPKRTTQKRRRRAVPPVASKEPS